MAEETGLFMRGKENKYKIAPLHQLYIFNCGEGNFEELYILRNFMFKLRGPCSNTSGRHIIENYFYNRKLRLCVLTETQ